MTWATIAALLAQYAFPFVDKVVTRWLTNPNGQPTADEWNALKTEAQQNAKTMLLAALARAGIPETDPHAQALLAQVPTS